MNPFDRIRWKLTPLFSADRPKWVWAVADRMCEAVSWVERVIYCHHNARVLSDMEYRLGCVLNRVTRTMSKPYYDLDDMYVAIDEYLNETGEAAVKEFVEDHFDDTSPDTKWVFEAAGLKYD